MTKFRRRTPIYNALYLKATCLPEPLEDMSAEARCQMTLEYWIEYPDLEFRKLVLTLLNTQVGTPLSERHFSQTGRQPGTSSTPKNLRTRMLIKTVQNSGLDEILKEVD